MTPGRFIGDDLTVHADRVIASVCADGAGGLGLGSIGYAECCYARVRDVGNPR
jgi:hypothetical protein